MRNTAPNEREPLLSSGPRASDPLEGIPERINQVNTEVLKLSKLADLLGTPKDTEQLRLQLRNKREECATLAKSTMQYLTKVKVTDRNQKVKYDKMKSQFMDIFNRCQQITKDSIQKERMTPVVASTSTSAGGSTWRGPASYGVKTSSESAVDEVFAQQTAQMKLEQETYNVDSAIIHERDNDIKFLESELQGLNEMFVDIATMIKEQGEQIDTLEGHATNAAASVEQGYNELKKASEYQKSNRKLLCIILLLVTIIFGIVAAVLGIIFGVLKK